MIHPIHRTFNQRKELKKEPNRLSLQTPYLASLRPIWIWHTLLFCLLATLSLNSFANIPNALHQHDSPYLAMHGKDPVNWQNWTAEVLKKAKTDNKLTFISSGYFSCHWCHVMQRENYLHQATANYLNQHFISVKIDRELNPELDKVLIEFSQKATGQAGWPQHVVLTPEGYPFAAFIYLNNADFNTTLQNIIKTWNEHPNEIRQLAKNFTPPSSQPSRLNLSSKTFETKLLQQVDLAKDDLSGGLTSSMGSSKFPKAPLLQSLLSIHVLPKSIEEWLLFTLDQMQSQHLFDHIHGGFYRYTIDPEWQIPHFEKMAYTSALLAKLYLQAGTRFQRPDYIETAKKTLTYLEQHLYNPNTQLYQSSQSAIDLKNQEGGDYLWTKAALQKQLSPEEWTLIKEAWHLDQPAPYELGWHPFPPSHAPTNSWKSIRFALQTPPNQIPVDSKSILGWNGLILSAYAQAYQTLKSPTYQQKGQTLAIRLTQLIEQTHPPRALSRQGKPMGEATLQDYAFIYQGLTDWQKATGKTISSNTLQSLKNTILHQFLNPTGWQYHASPLLPGQQSEWQMIDDAIPSPTAIVSCLKPDTLAFASTEILKNPIAYASYYQTLTKCAVIPALSPLKHNK